MRTKVIAIGILAGEVKEVDSTKDDKEAAEEGDCINGGGGVEALEEETRCDECACCEGDVVQGIDAVNC
jgi:hypothetical protein